MKLLGPIGADAVLVGDPRRAFALAQELLVQPRMSHQARGLWGYTGATPSGRPLTVQSTGSGGPSAVAIIADLAEAGMRRLVRLGTCVAPGTRCGDLLLVTRALATDGASRSLLQADGEASTRPDPALLAALTGLARPVVIASHDLVTRLDPEIMGPDPPPDPETPGSDPVNNPGPDSESESDQDVAGRDLQTAATFALARWLGLQAGAILVVADDGARRRLDEGELEACFRPLARKVSDRLERLRPYPQLQA